MFYIYHVINRMAELIVLGLFAFVAATGIAANSHRERLRMTRAPAVQNDPAYETVPQRFPNMYELLGNRGREPPKSKNELVYEHPLASRYGFA